ncbi:unnamed protein product [Prunus brigantina]
MDAHVAALETSNSKNQVILETIQHLLEDKFASIDKRLDSIDSRLEGFDQPFPPPSDDDDDDGSRRRGERDHRERERGVSSENQMPFVKIPDSAMGMIQLNGFTRRSSILITFRCLMRKR